jgi:cellulose biosynthesis protein BcsQ
MKIITVANRKEAMAKTTTAVTLAHGLASGLALTPALARRADPSFIRILNPKRRRSCS